MFHELQLIYRIGQRCSDMAVHYVPVSCRQHGHITRKRLARLSNQRVINKEAKYASTLLDSRLITRCLRDYSAG